MKSRLRQRLYPTLPRSPLDAWCARGLLVLAISGGVACALWLATLATMPWWLAWLLPTVLLLGPQLNRFHKAGTFLAKHHRAYSHVVVLLSGCLLFLFYPGKDLGGWLVFALLALHGFVLRYSRPDLFAAIALLLPLFELQLAHTVLWPMGWIARAFMATWQLLTLLLAFAVTTWLHARWTRRRLPANRHHFENAAETGDGLWTRARLMLIVGILLLPLGLGLQQLALFATVQPSELVAMAPPPIYLEGVGVSSLEENAPSGLDTNVAIIGRTLKREIVLPSTIDWQGKSVQSQKETEVFHLISDRDHKRAKNEPPYYSSARPLYLMATTYDRIDRFGLSRGPGAEVIHYADDGVGSDDWIIWDENLHNHPITKFKIRQRLLFNDSEGVKGTRGYLLHDRRLVAMRLPSCRLDADGTALGNLSEGDLLAYQWWSQPVPQALPLMPTANAPHRFLALPEDKEFQDWILDARVLCAESDSAEDKLARVVSFFKNEFSYDLEPSEGNGIVAFQDFFTKRRGYCSYFASAGMLYLRANGIACRVVSGFLVTEYSYPLQAYVGRISDAHAWLEVQQQDGSWRLIDPTPTNSRNALLAALRSAQQAVALPDANVQPQVLEVPEETQTEEVASRTAFGGFGLVPLVLTVILPIIIFALVLGSLWAKFFSQWQRNKERDTFGPEANLAMDYWARILWLLNELGFRSKRSQTAAEFAHHVQRWGGEFYRPLTTVTTLVYRSRFGGYPWSPMQEQFLEEYEQQLERKVQES